MKQRNQALREAAAKLRVFKQASKLSRLARLVNGERPFVVGRATTDIGLDPWRPTDPE